MSLARLLSLPLLWVTFLTPWHNALALQEDALQKANVASPKKLEVGYVPTPQPVVNLMLELADTKKTDLLYDLGCGDGRIVVTAARKYGCRAVGVDIDPARVRDSLVNVKEANLDHLVTIQQDDVFRLDLSEADVVALYLLPKLNVRLIPRLEMMKPGSRIVSHDFDMPGVEPDAVVTYSSPSDGEHKIYLWTVPLNKSATTDVDPSTKDANPAIDVDPRAVGLTYISQPVVAVLVISALGLAAVLWWSRRFRA